MSSPTFVAAGAVVPVPSNGNGSVNVPAPAGLQDDDIVLLFHIKGNGATPAVLSAPDFGGEIVGFNNGTFNIDYGIHVLRASSEPSFWTVQETASNSQGLAFAAAWRGVPPGASPVYEDLQTYLAPSATAAATPLPSATATSANSTLVGFIIDFTGGTVTFTPNGALTERYDNNSTSRSFALYDEAISSAGSITGRTVTPSGSARCRTVSILLPGTAPVADTTPPDITSTGTGSTNGPFAANVAEESTAAFITLTANENVTWGALGDADASRFTKLNETATTVQLGLSPALNFENLPHANPFVVTVTATDGSGNARTVTVNATVTNVIEPPGAPTIGTATAGNATVSVPFTLAAPNGGPTPYEVDVILSPGPITKTVVASPAVFTDADGVVNGTTYTGVAVARNTEGDSDPSAASNPVTPAAATYTATLEACAPNTGTAGVLLNQPFVWSAWPEGQAGALSGKTVVEGSGTTDPTTGEADITLPVGGDWAVWRRFTAVGTPTEDLQDVTAA